MSECIARAPRPVEALSLYLVRSTRPPLTVPCGRAKVPWWQPEVGTQEGGDCLLACLLAWDAPLIRRPTAWMAMLEVSVSTLDLCRSPSVSSLFELPQTFGATVGTS